MVWTDFFFFFLDFLQQMSHTMSQSKKWSEETVPLSVFNFRLDLTHSLFVALQISACLCVFVVVGGWDDRQHRLPGPFPAQCVRDFPPQNLPALHPAASSRQRHHPGHTAHTHQQQFEGIKICVSVRYSLWAFIWTQLCGWWVGWEQSWLKVTSAEYRCIVMHIVCSWHNNPQCNFFQIHIF